MCNALWDTVFSTSFLGLQLLQWLFGICCWLSACYNASVASALTLALTLKTIMMSPWKGLEKFLQGDGAVISLDCHGNMELC